MTVDDSHAKLAAEMEAWLRSAPRVTTHVWDLVNSWAARVEALGHEERGRVEEKKAAAAYEAGWRTGAGYPDGGPSEDDFERDLAEWESASKKEEAP